MNDVALLRMIQVSDSLFPIGAFTLSNGLETMVLEQKVNSIEKLEEYINMYIGILPYNELGIMILAYKNAKDLEYICQLDELGNALISPEEKRKGTQKLAKRFLKMWKMNDEYEKLNQYYEMIRKRKCLGHHSIVVGLYANELMFEAREAAAIYVYSQLSAIVTNAVKLVPLSQIDGQKLLHKILNKVPDIVEKAMTMTVDHLGVNGSEFDIASMNHEIMYSRLYMS